MQFCKGLFAAVLMAALTLSATQPTYAQILGDVNCDDDISAVDAMFIWQHDVSLRAGNEECPETGDGTLYAAVGDVNDDGSVDPADAMMILQCEVLLTNVFCPDEETSSEETSSEETGSDDTNDSDPDETGGEADGGTDTDANQAEAVDTVEITTVQNAETLSIQAIMSSTGSAENSSAENSSAENSNYDNGNIAAGSFELTYEGAQLVECTLLQGGACNTETAGVVRFNLVTTSGIENLQSIVELTFDSETIRITGFTATGLVNSQGQRLAHEFINGQEAEPDDNALDTQLFIPFING